MKKPQSKCTVVLVRIVRVVKLCNTSVMHFYNILLEDTSFKITGRNFIYLHLPYEQERLASSKEC